MSGTFTGIGGKERSLEQDGILTCESGIFTYVSEIFTSVGNKAGGLCLSRLPIGI